MSGALSRIANAIGKPFRPLRYRALYALHAQRFFLERERFAGRSVLVAGPARTLHEDLARASLRGFDVVVKMNNALHVL
jgi:hypothetical protein